MFRLKEMSGVKYYIYMDTRFKTEISEQYQMNSGRCCNVSVGLLVPLQVN